MWTFVLLKTPWHSLKFKFKIVKIPGAYLFLKIFCELYISVTQIFNIFVSYSALFVILIAFENVTKLGLTDG